jgi:tRNA pseudouridine38-40 synthase
MQKPWAPPRLLAAINAHLPTDVRARWVQEAPEGFFPRHHAVAKQYVYKFDEGPSANPFLEMRRWHLFGARAIDKGAISEAASCLVGTHNYSSFRCRECSAKTPIRTIFDIRLESSGSAFDLIFEGDRFLMHQVRIMVGTLVEIGRVKISPGRIVEILNSKDRSKAGPTAPPEGLYLEKIWYSSEWGIGGPCPWPLTAE